jgi:hypothetical protein
LAYSGQDLVNSLTQARKELFDSVANWAAYGHKLALAERDYRIAYRSEVFLLHTEDKVAWTAAVDIAKGEESTVANLRYARDVAKVQYDAEQEKINALKIEIRVLEHESQEGLRGYGK